MSSSKERAQSVGHKPKTPNFGKSKIYQKPKVSRNGGLFSKLNDDFSELASSILPSPYTPYIREGILEMNSEEENYTTIHNTPSN